MAGPSDSNMSERYIPALPGDRLEKDPLDPNATQTPVFNEVQLEGFDSGFTPQELENGHDPRRYAEDVATLIHTLVTDLKGHLHADSGFNAFLRDGNLNHLSEASRKRLTELREDISQLEAIIDSSESRETLENIAVTYDAADTLTRNLVYKQRGEEPTKAEYLGGRIAAMGGNILVISDIDNTGTEERVFRGKGEDPTLNSLLPWSLIFDKEMKMARDSSSNPEQAELDVFDATLATASGDIMANLKELFELGALATPIREGELEFHQQLADSNVPVAFVSMGAEPSALVFAERFGYNTQGKPKAEVHAISPSSVRASRKRLLINLLSIQNKDKAVIYVGDGGSDVGAVDAADPATRSGAEIAGALALRNGSFAKGLETKSTNSGKTIPYATYNNGFEKIAFINSAREFAQTHASFYESIRKTPTPQTIPTENRS